MKPFQNIIINWFLEAVNMFIATWHFKRHLELNCCCHLPTKLPCWRCKFNLESVQFRFEAITKDFLERLFFRLEVFGWLVKWSRGELFLAPLWLCDLALFLSNLQCDQIWRYFVTLAKFWKPLTIPNGNIS